MVVNVPTWRLDERPPSADVAAGHRPADRSFMWASWSVHTDHGRGAVTLRALLAVLRRRWFVLIAVLLLTGVVMALVHARPITYEACGSLTLLPPKVGYQPNRYGSSLPPLVTTSGLLAQQVNSHQVRQRLAAEGLTASYDAEVLNTGTLANPTYTEPLVNVCSFAYGPVPPLNTTNAVIKTFSERLRALQAEAHVPRAGLITDEVVGPAS